MINEKTILIQQEQAEQQINVASEQNEKSIEIEQEGEEQVITVIPENEEQIVPVTPDGVERMVDIEREAVLIGSTPINQIHIGTTAEWEEFPELVGELEHIYIYTDYNTINNVDYPGIKIGDGETLLANLPFAAGNNNTIAAEYYNKIQVDQKLSEKVNNSELNNYYNKTQVDQKLSEKADSSEFNNYYNKTQVDQKLSSKADSSELNNYFRYIDLGDFSMEDYNWDFWAYLEDKIESGFYHLFEVEDGFDYFFRVERAGASCYQEWWYAEEGSLMRMCRNGWQVDENVFEWGDPTEWLTTENAYNTFATKQQTYTKQEVNNLLSNKVDNDTLGNYYTDSEVDDILENNYYTMDQVDEMLEGFAPNNMIETTWANLRNLRDNSQLVKGAWYRITDYNFVTTKLGMQSGNHPFDIVLLAISESMLSESGYACKHAGDHYFEREVTEGGIEWFYTMYVDEYGENYGDEPMDHQDDLHSSDEFCDSGVLPHPNTGDDVPVLYKTATDEYDIDDPDYDDAYFYEGTYDFDGDEYDMWSKYEFDGNEWNFMMQYALTPIVVENGELIVSPIPETKIVPVNMNSWELKYCLDNDKDLFDWAETDGKGVIYYLKDEFGNEAPYDFKNAMFRRYQVSGSDQSILSSLRNLYLYQDGYYSLTRNNNNKYWYTFASQDGASDGSLFGECTYNVIMPYIYLSPKGKNIRGINNIVLQSANHNYLNHNCFDITILNSIANCLFNNCNNICGQSYSNVDISTNCAYFTIDRTSNSKYSDGTRYIIGRSVDAAITGSGCTYINFGDNCVGMQLGNSCNHITFGQWGYNNNIGAGTTNVTFGNYCSYNIIGKVCSNITFTNYYRYITIEDNVTRLTFTTTGGSTSQYVQYVKVCKGINNKEIAPTRRTNYEQIYYAIGRVETEI